MANYKLSSAADKDFELLFEYGIDNFGLSKAKSYVDGLIIMHILSSFDHPMALTLIAYSH